MPDPTLALTYALGAPKADAVIRAQAEDFEVEEVLRFEPTGEGEHAILRIRKRNLNTRAVARALERHAGVRAVDVGFAGMKDRDAIATQWFSVALAGRREPDWSDLNSDRLELLRATRHARKLRPGQLMQNRFRITLRDVQGDYEELEGRLVRIDSAGVPNYFGPQRFGRDGANLAAARELFQGVRRVRDRKLRGIYLSAARARVFNHVLSARVTAGSWNRALPGEVLMFDHSRSRFSARGEDLADDPRIGKLELHPTGPLWGKGSPDSAGEARIYEQEAARALSDLTAGLESAGLKADRRALRVRVEALDSEAHNDGSITLCFALRPGAFATAVLRELVLARDRSRDQPG